MDIFTDFKFWLFVISVCQTGLMTYGFIIIKFNYFKNLTKDVSEIQKDVKEINCKVQQIDKVLAVQIQRIDVLEKSTK